MRVALAFLLVLAGCADKQPPPRNSGTGSGSSAAGSAGSAAGSGAAMNAAVTVSLVGTKPGRPPVEKLLVDVQLRNDDSAARWVLIPTSLPVDTGGGVDKLEQLTVPAGGSTLAVGRFLGRAGTYALKLAPGARVNLRKLEVSWWRPESGAKAIAFDVVLASDVKIGDAAMATWFDKDPAIGGSADVDMEGAKHTRSQKSPDDSELPLGTVDATRVPVELVAR